VTGVQTCALPISSLLDVRRQIYRRLDKRVDALSPAAIASIRRQGDFDARAKRLARLVGQGARSYSGKDLWNAYQEYYDSGYNSAPLDTIGTLLERLVRGEVISREASENILEIMSECETGGNRIRAGLPAEVKLIHKTGTQHRRLCDLGVFYLTDEEPVVFSICLKNFEDQPKAEALVARFASRAYALLLKKRKPSVPESQLAIMRSLPPLVPLAGTDED
jgi:beta-lactamase class A